MNVNFQRLFAEEFILEGKNVFLKEKKKILDLLGLLPGLLSKGNSNFTNAVLDCIDAIEIILDKIKREENTPQQSINHLSDLKEMLFKIKDKKSIDNQKNVDIIIKHIELAQNLLKVEIQPKLKVAFFPYKISMWDSLESIYETAAEDQDCDPKVVPIPYYELTPEKRIPKYEGDRFPKNIPIVHYSKYNLKKEEPDIIYVHNIYDQYNTITQVHENFFTSNLKKYTNMLVYVPYHISSFIVTKSARYLAYAIPSMNNVDKIILAGEHVKKAALRDGISEEKILVLGSPKFDKIVNTLKKENYSIPKEWEEKIKGKTVFLLNTGCLFFANEPFFKISMLSNFLNIPHIVENSILIWRPHPLTRVSIIKYTPYLLDYYDILTKEYIKKRFIYKDVILDETDDYIPALTIADILISEDGSLLRSFLVTGKKILFVHNKIPKNPSFLSQTIIPSEAFYYFYSNKEPWPETVKKIAQGDDPLSKKRKKLAESRYVNIDGTCGEKVYKAIKNCVLGKIFSNEVL